ncbi:MAG: DUF418 domain-containing protein [Aquiluna sp.]|jgi:uncharacterized protein
MTKTRDSFPDILRGFALLGIAMVNVQYFATDTVIGFEGGDLANPANAAAAFIVASIFQAKFYLLFSFLFGYSAHYVIKNERANSRRFLARSSGLILLGGIHLVFLFHGDILFFYGVLGLLLLLLYFRSEKAIERWARWIFIVNSIGLAGIAALAFAGEAFLASKGKALPAETSITPDLNGALATGTFLEAAAARFELWLVFAPQGVFLQGPMVFAAFLVGVLVARKDGLASGVNPAFMRKAAVWGLSVGLLLQVLSGYLFVSNVVSENYSLGIYLASIAINFITAPLLSAGYVGSLWLLSQRFDRFKLLSAAGRHSLTIYLSQSLVFSVLFSAWGFGLFAQLQVWQVALTAALVWLGLSLLALLNLRYNQRGPMEALLSNFSKIFRGKS